MLIPLGFLFSKFGPDASHWLGMYTDTGTDYTNLLNAAMDSSGNVFFVGSVDQDGIPQKVYLTKFSSAGVLLWQRSLAVAAGTSASEGRTVDTDAAGNVYIVSQGYNSSVSLQTISLAKYDTSGTLQWQRMIYKTGGQAQGYGVKVASSGNIYVCGYTQVGAAPAAILAKYNSSGTLQWQRTLAQGTYATWFRAVGIDASENIFVGGQGNVSGSARELVAKYNSSGTLQWQRQMSGLAGASSMTTGSMMDPSGNFYVVTDNFLLAKYDTSGTLLWQRTISANYGLSGYSTDLSGNVYVTGTDGTPRGIVIFKYDSSGTLQWQRKIKSNNTSYPMYSGGIYADGFNNLYIAAQQRISSADTGTLGFFAKLLQDGSLTGTYTVGTYAINYAASALATSTPTNTSAASTYSDAVGAATEIAGNLVAGTPSRTPTVKQIP